MKDFGLEKTSITGGGTAARGFHSCTGHAVMRFNLSENRASMTSRRQSSPLIDELLFYVLVRLRLRNP